MHKFLWFALGFALVWNSIAPAPTQETKWRIGQTRRSEVLRVLGKPAITMDSPDWVVDFYPTNFQQCWRYSYNKPLILLHSYQVASCPRGRR